MSSQGGGSVQVGAIHYELSVDTKGLIDAERQAEKSTAKMAGSLTAVAQASQIHAQAAGIAATAVREATKANDAAAASATKAAKANQDQAMSAKALAAATRNIPAQATDIITGLSTGQSPLTVLLQQGGQLKDMFGGVVPAAKAFGGYIAGLITPFTAAAAAAGVFVYGLIKGKEEMADFNRNLILAGSQSGVTANQLNSLAAQLGKTSGIARSEAADGLNVFVQAGISGERNLARFTEAAIRMEKAGGPSIEKTAAAFRELGKDPVDASMKLNEQVNFLTVDLYKQIKALDEQGKHTEAARVAQNAFADALLQRAPQVIDNLGYIERGWNAIKGAVKGAANAVLDFGRTKTQEQDVAELEKLVKKRDEILARGPTRSNQLEAAQYDAQIDRLRVKLALAGDLEDKARVSALMAEDQAKQVAALNDFDKAGVQFLDKKLKMERDIAAAREMGKAAGLDEAKIQQRIKEIRASYAEKKQPFDSDKYVAELAARGAEEIERINIMEQEALREADKKFKDGELKSEEQHQAARNLIIDAAYKQRSEIAMRRGEEYRQYIETSAKKEDEAKAKAEADRQKGRNLASGIIAGQDEITKVQAEATAKSEALLQAFMIDQQNAELYAQARVVLEQETAAKIKEIRDRQNAEQAQAQYAQLMAFSQLFDGIAGLTQSFAGKQSGAYRAMFAVSKGFSIASATLSIATGLAEAQKLGFPANIAEMARVAATGASLMSTIRSTNYGGGRLYGGPVSSGSIYRVNESGRPEMFTATNGAQYLMPTANGSVTPADQVGGVGGAPWKLVVMNAPAGYQPAVDQNERALIIDMAAAQAEARVANGISQNSGPVWTAMRSSTNVRGQL